MKRIYKTPTLEAKEYAQLENVFTYCNKVMNGNSDCTNVTGTGNDSDKEGNPSGSNAHKDGGNSGGGDIDPS